MYKQYPSVGIDDKVFLNSDSQNIFEKAIPEEYPNAGTTIKT
jgi:hypothetical protein